MWALPVLVWLALLSGYDLCRRRLPNWLTLPGAVAVPVAAAGVGRGPAALAGAGALTAVYLAVHLLTPAGLGAGDVKLAAGLGALTGMFGADAWLVAALAAPLLTAALGLVLRRWRGSTTVAHGPAMCLASLAVIAPAMF